MIRIFIIILLFSLNSNAQYNDFGVWSNFGLSYKINKDYKLKYNLGYRTEENSKYTNRIYNEVSLEYNLFKYLELGLEYRNTFYRNIDFTYSNEHRLNPTLVFSYKINKLFDIDFRSQYQIDFSNGNNDDFYISDDIRNQVRFRPRVKLDVGKRSTLNFSYEAFFHLAEPNNYLRRERFSLELSSEYIKYHNIEIAYLYQYNLNTTNQRFDNVLKLSYSYNLN